MALLVESQAAAGARAAETAARIAVLALLERRMPPARGARRPLARARVASAEPRLGARALVPESAVQGTKQERRPARGAAVCPARAVPQARAETPGRAQAPERAA